MKVYHLQVGEPKRNKKYLLLAMKISAKLGQCCDNN